MNKNNQLKLADLVSEYLSGYVYPFENADEVIAKMGNGAFVYYQKCRDIVESEVWKNEFSGMLKHFFHHCAFKATTEKTYSEQDCYKISLIFFQEFEKRLKTLAALSNSPLPRIAEQQRRQEGLDKKV